MAAPVDSAAPRGDGLRRLYGRRQGRPLRAGRRHLIDDLLPGLAIPLDNVATASLDPKALFAAPREVWLEIGFGGGEHLAAQARANPAIGVIGVEPFINGAASLLKAIDAEKLTNVRLLMDDARPLLEALAPRSIARAFILFPDPWPKRRHWKRRIVSRAVLDQLARVLVPGAELRLATDDPDYADWMLLAVLAHPDFIWTARGPSDWRVRPADQPQTRYESKALAAGRKPLFVVARRR
ncbi:MAG TPA: tRNA (guanosine(46)-N7)-methyltransferase TrmB [Alphaproteobacteria bacterium]|jgi:tRNA (guanine-N7-)-methyltransferase|nr:tRNA (guanosine(46)-N7)-methyltransferase TrmB [Alphaproteobacteria bacterium]